MLGASVALHLLEHGVAERALGQHALDSLLKNASEALLQLGEVGFVDAARVTGVTIVLLVLGLVAGHAQLLDVDDDDVIAGINVRGVDGFMFAAQATRNFGKPTKDQIRRRQRTSRA
jgi:hypothetical protein